MKQTYTLGKISRPDDFVDKPEIDCLCDSAKKMDTFSGNMNALLNNAYQQTIKTLRDQIAKGLHNNCANDTPGIRAIVLPDTRIYTGETAVDLQEALNQLPSDHPIRLLQFELWEKILYAVDFPKGRWLDNPGGAGDTMGIFTTDRIYNEDWMQQKHWQDPEFWKIPHKGLVRVEQLPTKKGQPDDRKVWQNPDYDWYGAERKDA